MKCVKLSVLGVVLILVMSLLPTVCVGEDFTDKELLKSIKFFVTENAVTDGNWTTVSIKDWKSRIGRSKIDWSDEDITRVFCNSFQERHTDIEILSIQVIYVGRSGGGTEPSYILVFSRRKLPWNVPRR